MEETWEELITRVRHCTLCADDLPFGANPVFVASPESKILIIGQAPGRVVHQTHIPWNDKSGDNLRSWLGVDGETFYDTSKFALVPMGFCYPGTGKSGDFPPRKECAPLWHPQLLERMPNVRLILLVGNYAQNYYLPEVKKKTLTEIVKEFHQYGPLYFPLPHPSPRNNLWMAKNKWFEAEVLPELNHAVKSILDR